MRIKVLFFGQLKEIVGRAEEELEIGVDDQLVDLYARYGAAYPEAERLRTSVVPSVNQEFAPWEARLHHGDEVAFLPPVSGG
jgi:molybdopterin converting factor subunit 1